jgi:hypothetical protein
VTYNFRSVYVVLFRYLVSVKVKTFGFGDSAAFRYKIMSDSVRRLAYG